jgi:hypothetical protein
MKTLRLSALITISLLMVLAAGCSKKSNPVGSTPPPYIDTYSVILTDSAGTTYDENFFPLNAGDRNYYSGEQTATVTTTGTAPSTQTVDIFSHFEVLDKRLVQLTAGPDSLNPVVDFTNSGPDTSRFFKKDTFAVYIKAFRLIDGSFYEVANPVFIKSKLVAGDTWEAAPQMDMTKILASELSDMGVESSNLTIIARSKFFVVGKEEVTLGTLGTRKLIRLEQANDISMSGSIIYMGSPHNLTMSAKFATVYHLIADTGIVHQNVTGTMTGTLSGLGSMTMTLTKSELILTYRYSQGMKVTSGRQESVDAERISSGSETNSDLRKITEMLFKGMVRAVSIR